MERFLEGVNAWRDTFDVIHCANFTSEALRKQALIIKPHKNTNFYALNRYGR